MKKNLLYLTMAMFMGLFASCSQEDAPTQGLDSSSVSLSAQLPDAFAKTRAVPTADSDHQLRCVLEVWDQASPAALVYREEKLGAGENITFNFNIPEGQKYDCLMWADFVAKEAAITSVTKGEVTYSHYADTYYNTSDLKNIKIGDPTKNFNNDACDAYFGNLLIDKTMNASTSLSIKLGRPFMRLAFKEKVAENYDKCKTLDVSYEMPDGFNVLDGSVASKVAATYNGTPAGKEGDLTLFYNYLFANKEDGTLGEIVMKFNDQADQPIRTVTVQSGTPLKRNYKVNAIGNLVDVTAGNTTIVIDFDNSWEDEEDGEVTPENSAKVGDFFYSDGTFSTELVTDGSKTCVGIVFAVSANGGDAATDVVGNYPDTGLTKVNGWVVALTQSEKLAWSNSVMSEKIADIAVVTKDNGDYLGYKNTQAVKTYASSHSDLTFAAVTTCTDWNVKVDNGVAISGWYLPAIGQLTALTTNVNAVNGSLGKIIDATTIPPTNSLLNYWSSTYYDAGADIKICQKQWKLDTETFIFRSEKTNNAAGVVRPILTF